MKLLIGAVALAMTTGQQTFVDEAPALLDASLKRIEAAAERLAFDQARCAFVYAAGTSNPAAVEALGEARNLQLEPVDRAVERARGTGAAEGGKLAADLNVPVRQCVEDIEQRAEDLREQVQSFRSIMRQVEQNLRR